MKSMFQKAFAGIGALMAACTYGQTKLEMPKVGERLPGSTFELVNRIPRSQVRDLPKMLPVFRYSAKPREFQIEHLQKLLAQSVFAGTNITNLLQGRTNAVVLGEPIRLGAANGLNSFFADPFRGGIVLQAHGTGIDLRREIPPYDAVPDFDSIRDRVLRYAQMFGVATNELVRKDDGSILLFKTDDKTVMRGGAIKFISKRSVRVSRSVAGYTFLANDDKIELALGVNGWLRKFEMKWPTMEAVRTNRLFTIDRILDEIKRGNVLADVSNEYPADGISQIILKGIRVDYYAFPPRGFEPVSTNTDIFPVASLYAVFKSKSGKKQEGGLYAPILDSK